jgi:hypothetical protein
MDNEPGSLKLPEHWGNYEPDEEEMREIKERLEYLRSQIRAERISMGEIAELQELAPYIDPGDVELMEWAGLEESPEMPDQIPDEHMPDPLESQFNQPSGLNWDDPRNSKVGMAEQSGFPELDAAIQEFMQDPEIQQLRDPRNAWGRCEEIAEQCAEFLKQRGFKAYAPSDDLEAFPGYENAQKSEDVGAGDFSYPEHAMVEVYGLYGPNNVNNVTIDFTASQYGFTEFPKIHGGKFGSMSEWRVPTSTAVDLTHVNGQPWPGQGMPEQRWASLVKLACKIAESDGIDVAGDFLFESSGDSDLSADFMRQWGKVFPER